MAMAMTKTRISVVLAYLLFAVGNAEAATDSQIRLEATSAAFGPGSAGDAVPLFFSVEHSLGSTGPLPSDFELTAESMRVEVDHATAARAGTLAPVIPDNTTQGHYNSPSVHGTENRDGYRFMVVPTADTTVHVRSSCASPAPSEREALQREPHAADPSERRPVDVDVSKSLEWRNCGASSLIFAGDFLLNLWEIDFEIEDAAGTTEYQTGQGQHELTAGIPNDPRVVGHRREAWLFVQDGQLSVDLVPESPSLLYVSSGVHVQSESGILLQDASGHIQLQDQAFDIGGQDVLVKGALSTDLSRSSSGSLMVGVSGQIQGLQVDEVDVWSRATTAAAQASLRVPTWALGSGALLLFSVVLGSAGIWWSAPLLIFHVLHGDDCIRRLPANTMAQRRAAALGCLANRLLTRTRELAGWHAWSSRVMALLLSQQAHRLDPHARVYLVWRSRAYAGLGAHKKALRDCSLLNERLEGPQALSKNAVLAARCAKELGRMEEHRAWVLVASRWRSTSPQRTNRGAPLGSIRGPRSPGVTARVHESSLPC